MIILITYGRFLFVPSRMLTQFFLIFYNMLLCTSAFPYAFIQCDNGREFDNASNRNFFLSIGTFLRFSCPYTSPQNGKAEWSLRSINDILRTLLIQASLPPRFWAEALRTATFLLNIWPTKHVPSIHLFSPFFSIILTIPLFVFLDVYVGFVA